MHACVSIVAAVSIFLVGIGACDTFTSFHSNEGGHRSENFDSIDAALRSCSPCSEIFISESYFRKYGHLVDSNFQEFIAHKLKEASPDEALPRVSKLQHQLIGEGFHRILRSSVTLDFPPGFTSNVPKQLCQLIVVERLPDGVIADPFELKHLLQRGVFKDAAVFGDTNLELPSFLSNRSLVEVHRDVPLHFSSREGDTLQLNIEIPLHARYQPLDESGYSKVRFGAPDLFIRCNEEGKRSSQSCSLTVLNYTGDLRTDNTVWSIPCGIQAHAGVVSVVTFAAALLSTIVIVVTSLRRSRSCIWKPEPEKKSDPPTCSGFQTSTSLECFIASRNAQILHWLAKTKDTDVQLCFFKVLIGIIRSCNHLSRKLGSAVSGEALLIYRHNSFTNARS